MSEELLRKSLAVILYSSLVLCTPYPSAIEHDLPPDPSSYESLVVSLALTFDIITA
jgi:hypothetical protein